MPAFTTLILSAIVRRDGPLLLVEQRGPADPEPSWMLPGGGVEEGEALVAALERELAEETGLVRAAAWVEPIEALARLRCIEWYDCLPLERFLAAEASTGALYSFDRP